jgi:hypothetical protein
MIHAGAQIVAKCLPVRRSGGAEARSGRCWTQHSGADRAVERNIEQTTVTRIHVSKQAIVHLQRLHARGTPRAEIKDGVSTVSVSIQEQAGGAQVATVPTAGEAQPSKCVTRDIRLARTHFTPGQQSIAIRIERQHGVEIAQGDIPVPGDRVGVRDQREVTVAGLMRPGGCCRTASAA